MDTQRYIARCLFVILFVTPLIVHPADSTHAIISDNLKYLIQDLARSEKTRDRRITVIIESDAINKSILQSISSLQGHLKYSKHRLHEISIPASAISRLQKRLPADIFIRLPYPHAAVSTTSQGVAIMGAEDMHNLQQLGAGARVGIIDLGFSGYTNSISSNDLPQNLTIKDYTGTGTGGTNHGTSVAEIVYDMAPESQLYLAKIGSSLQLDAAVNDMLASGIKIINHSVAWFGAAFYDGTGELCNITDGASASGLLWVNAMGNSRNSHYLGTFTDTDGDLRHDFTTNPAQNYNTVNLTQNVPYELVFNWDRYPTTRDVDYNIYLYDKVPTSNTVPVAKSENPQRTPYRIPPLEIISYMPVITGTHYIVITKSSASTPSIPLSLFSNSATLGIKITTSSLPQPADCNSVLSVGAVDLNDQPESYSSEGPTVDGRNKPEIAATDKVTTSISTKFAGTSASSPHVAGAAALIYSQNPSMSNTQIRNNLIASAQDVFTSGYDFRSGSGRVSIDADLDGINHDNDNCPLVSNSNQLDTDNDQQGDACDSDKDGDRIANDIELSIGTDPLLSDTDGDGIIDGDEVFNYFTNPLLKDSDMDMLDDGYEINVLGTDANKSNLGDLSPVGAPDDQVNISDLMILYRYIHKQLLPSNQEFSLADLNGDSVLDVRDVIVLMKTMNNQGN